MFRALYVSSKLKTSFLQEVLVDFCCMLFGHLADVWPIITTQPK